VVWGRGFGAGNHTGGGRKPRGERKEKKPLIKGNHTGDPKYKNAGGQNFLDPCLGAARKRSIRIRRSDSNNKTTHT